jgi:hypothetical protein
VIVASEPVSFGGQSFDGWTVESVTGRRLDTNTFRATIVLRRCLVSNTTTGGTQTLRGSTATETVMLEVPNVYAAALSFGAWWTTEVRALVLTAAAAIEAAAEAVGAAKGVL